jgi:hypothetical protein
VAVTAQTLANACLDKFISGPSLQILRIWFRYSSESHVQPARDPIFAKAWRSERLRAGHATQRIWFPRRGLNLIKKCEKGATVIE